MASVVVSLLHSLRVSGPVPRVAAPRNPRAPTSAHGCPSIAAPTSPFDVDRPDAVGVALASLARLAAGSSHRQAGDRRRLAPTRLSALLDLEEPPAPRPTDVPADVRALIRELSSANPLWGAPRIHGELQKVGISVSQSTVATLMKRHSRPPSQTWRTFLTNHASQIMAADLFVVPTVTFRLLFVLVILEHDRRRIAHVAVTEHPTAAWTAQQLRNAFPDDHAPRYLLHDRDGAFAAVATTVADMNIQTVRTAPRSPWQNAYIERVIGSIRRECLDHVIVMNEAGVRRVLASYVAYCMRSRTHLSLAKSGATARPSEIRRRHRRDSGSRRPAPPLRPRRGVAGRLRPNLSTALGALPCSTRRPAVRRRHRSSRSLFVDICRGPEPTSCIHTRLKRRCIGRAPASTCVWMAFSIGTAKSGRTTRSRRSSCWASSNGRTRSISAAPGSAWCSRSSEPLSGRPRIRFLHQHRNEIGPRRRLTASDGVTSRRAFQWRRSAD